MFVTMFIATVDLKTGRMNYCNAGHNPPLLDGEFMTVEPNAPLGLWQELEFVEEHQNSIKGRSLFLYTDGITEAENEHKDQYGEDRMQELLKKNLHRSAHQTIDCIHESVSQFVGKAEPSDDITKLCLKLI
jgi:serine phosphatase RsbU (regulator of sigma subunit)